LETWDGGISVAAARVCSDSPAALTTRDADRRVPPAYEHNAAWQNSIFKRISSAGRKQAWTFPAVWRLFGGASLHVARHRTLAPSARSPPRTCPSSYHLFVLVPASPACHLTKVAPHHRDICGLCG